MNAVCVCVCVLVRFHECACNSRRTTQPLVGDVLEHCDRDAEEGNEQITECQRADEDVGDGVHGLAAGHHIDHQRVAKERQGKNECSCQRKSQFSARWQLGSVNQRPQPIEMNELLPSQVVRTQQPGELLRGDVERLHAEPVLPVFCFGGSKSLLTES